jgi:hypothetical protein
VVRLLRVEKMSKPGAAIVTSDPKFEKDARSPVSFVAATEITPRQLAGVKLAILMLSLPEDATTIEPDARAASMAC